jgi:predicted glycosyltransferase
VDAANKAIWIDLDNSPHVPLFAPVIRHFRDSGVDVVLTARDHSQTLELLDLAGLDDGFTVVGRHYGKSRVGKVRGLFARARQLVAHIVRLKRKGQKIAVAVSHGSRSMVLAAWWLKIPVITMYDYEFTETTIFNRFSDKVLVPDRIPDEVLDEIGLAAGKRARYPGIKEELYVRSFEPGSDFRQMVLSELTGRDVSDCILAVLRPPATTANYHSDKSEVLFDDILHFLLGAHNVLTVVIPRTPEQAAGIEGRVAGVPDSETKCLILKEAVDGLALASAADLLISGGGTMNREAALLGVPVYSIFAGRQGALDRQMEAEGLITFIRDARDLSKIRIEKRVPAQANALTDRVESFVIEQIGRYLN